MISILTGLLDQLLGSFPHDTVPDGEVMAPHHLYTGILVTALAVYVVSDDYRHREPVLVLSGLLVSVFGFLLTWPLYAEIGAVFSLGGLVAALAALTSPSLGADWWDSYPRRWHAVAVIGILIGLDDVVEHAFGVWTPLDAVVWPIIYSVIG